MGGLILPLSLNWLKGQLIKRPALYPWKGVSPPCLSVPFDRLSVLYSTWLLRWPLYRPGCVGSCLVASDNLYETNMSTYFIVSVSVSCGHRIMCALGAIHIWRPQNFRIFGPPPPLVRKFTQPPLLSFITLSAFEGTPLPLSADVIYVSSLAWNLNSLSFFMMASYGTQQH